jgi:hypothetical protein
MLERLILSPKFKYVVCHVGDITGCKELNSENLEQSCINQSSGSLKVSWKIIILNSGGLQ